MSWGYRQERLRSLVGPNTNLCFQALVSSVVSTNYSVEEDFNAVAKQYGISMDGQPVVRLPKKNYMEERFNDGFLMKIGDNMQAQVVNAQAIYTEVPRNPYKGYSDHKQMLDDVIDRYIPAIEQHCPDLNFRGDQHAANGSLGVSFAFIVRPYDPQICHPRDIGVFKPITIIGEHTIHPV